MQHLAQPPGGATIASPLLARGHSRDSPSLARTRGHTKRQGAEQPSKKATLRVTSTPPLVVLRETAVIVIREHLMTNDKLTWRAC